MKRDLTFYCCDLVNASQNIPPELKFVNTGLINSGVLPKIGLV